MSSGYSKRPLVKKLGIKEGFKVRLVLAPPHFLNLLDPIPEAVEFMSDASEAVDYIHLFAKDVATFEQYFLTLKDEIKKDGMIWVSWYKKSSKIPTDMSEDVIRNMALSLGLVDVKVCAVDEQWSGLKIVWRKENR